MRSRGSQLAVARTLTALLVAAPLLAQQGAGDPGAIWTAAAAAAGVDPQTTATVSAYAGRLGEHRRQIAVGSETFDLVILSTDHAAPRVVDAATGALERLFEWFEWLPPQPLTIVDVPSISQVSGASYPGVIVVSTRWLSTSRDLPMERSLFAALARQFVLTKTKATGPQAELQEGMALYLATRLIHQQLQTRNFLTLRYFGGAIPFSLRGVLLSPHRTDPRPVVRHLADVEEPAEAPWRAASAARGGAAQRIALALHTLERFIGWPTLQAVIAEFWRDGSSRFGTSSELAATAERVTGSNLSWFFDQAFRAGVRFDYAVDQFESEPVDGGYRTTLRMWHEGDGVVAARALSVLTQFEDGSRLTELIDGRKPEQSFEYRSASRATLASVDPDAVWLLDADRANNTRTRLKAAHPVGMRLVVNWMEWLQGALLAYTAVL